MNYRTIAVPSIRAALDLSHLVTKATCCRVMMGSNVSDTKLKPTAKKPATRKAAPHAPELSKDDVYLFGIGTWERSWEKMGAHPDTQNRTRGWRFCVWAPDVKSVHVIGEFNDWDEEANPLVPVHTSTIWEGFIPGAEQGQLYKYLIETNEGEKLYKADPYAFKAECPPGTASVLWALDGYKWNDAAWLKRRAGHNHMSQPLNIYEVHIGSWKRHGDAPQGEPDEYGNYPGPMDPFPAQRGEFYTYDDLSVELVDYVRHGLHAYRGHAAYGASLRWLLGLPDNRLLRRHVALRQPAAAHALY